MPAYYFAYGSNMNLELMKERCGSIWKVVGIGYVEGYELVFDGYSSFWSGAVANIVKNPKERVWGVVYEFSSEDEIRRCLDRYEGAPMVYDLQDLEVFIPEKGVKILAKAYVRKELKERGKPSKKYLETLIKGAEENGLPKEWMAHLKKYFD